MSINWNGSKNSTFNDLTILNDATVDNELFVDTINERTSANGIDIDGVSIKDGGLTFGGSNQTALSYYEVYTNPSQIIDDNSANSGVIPAGSLVIQRIGNFCQLKYTFVGAGSPSVSIFDFGTTIPARFFPSTHIYTERQMVNGSANSSFAFSWVSPSEFRIGKVNFSGASVNFQAGENISNVLSYYLD